MKGGLGDRIGAVAERLTPTERRIAELALSEPTLLAFGTVADVAARLETSGPTVVRFAAKLGFDGYTDLQSFARGALAERLTRPTDRVRGEESSDTMVERRNAMEAAIESVFTAAGGGQLETAAASIAAAVSVWVLSGETSRAGGHSLAKRLQIIRPRVRMLEEFDTGVDLADLEPHDVVIAIDFPRYRAWVVETAVLLASRDIPVIAITDGPLSPLSAVASVWFDVAAPGIGPFDSSVAAVALGELILAEVTRVLKRDAADRIDAIENLWSATGTFFDRSS